MTMERAVMMGRVATLVVATVLFQVALASDLTVFGVRPELTMLAAAAAGVAGGPERGVVAGFSAGLLHDLYLQTPLGLTALVFAVLGYLVGAFQLRLTSQSRLIRVVSVAAGTAAGVIAWVTVAHLIDQTSAPMAAVFRVMVISAVLNGLLALPVTRMWRWAYAPVAPVRVPI